MLLVRCLRIKRIRSIGQMTRNVWNLSLASSEHDANLGCSFPTKLTGAYTLGRVKGAEFRLFLCSLDRSRPLLQRHKPYTPLENGVRELLKNEGFIETDLKWILPGSRYRAYLRMPAITAAQRSRKLVNHPPERSYAPIFAEIRVEDGLNALQTEILCGSETGEAEKEIADKTKVEAYSLVRRHARSIPLRH